MATALNPIIAPAGIQAGTPFVGAATGGDVLFVKQTNPAIAVSTPLVHINVSTTPPQIQIGPFSSALGVSQIPGATVIGSGATGTAGGNGNIVVIGTNATTASTQDDVIIGHGANAPVVNNGGVAVGVGAQVGVGAFVGGVAIGSNAVAGNGVAIGPSATCTLGQGEVAIGFSATAANLGVAVGGSANAGVGAAHGFGSVAIGRSASAQESTDIVIGSGNGGTTGTGGNIVLGSGVGTAATSGHDCVCVGSSSNTGGGVVGANSTGNFNTVIGGNSTSANNGCRVFGRGVSTTANNQTLIGGTDDPCANVFLGNGVTNAAPQNVVVGVTGGTGLNAAGASHTMAGGIATGNAVGGSIVFQTSVVAASSSTPQALATALTIDNTQSLLIAQKVTQYLGVSTVGAGLTPIYAKTDLTAQTAAITATTIYAVPASGAGLYRVSWSAVVTTAGTTSTLGGASGFQVVYTDNDTGASATTPAAGAPAAATNTAYSQTNQQNTVGTQASGSIIVNAKASTNIQYQFGYASSGTAMQFALHVKVQYLGA